MKVVSDKNLQIATLVICALLVFMALLIVVPLAIVQASVDGECLLYADTREYGPRSVCGYPIAIATIFQICYCIARFILTLLILLGVLTVEVLSPKRFTLPCAIADVIVCLLTLVSAGIISHGFSVMCSNIFYPKSDRCGTVGIYIAATDSFLENYYQRLNVAEVGRSVAKLGSLDPPCRGAGPAVSRPLMSPKTGDSEDEIMEADKKISRPIYRRTVAPT
nr:hypothetical protein BaRGS_026448 [Batillaria attramentaria]